MDGEIRDLPYDLKADKASGETKKAYVTPVVLVIGKIDSLTDYTVSVNVE